MFDNEGGERGISFLSGVCVSVKCANLLTPLIDQAGGGGEG